MVSSLLALFPALALSQLALSYPLASNETINVFSKRDTLICGFAGRLVDFHSCLPAGINFKLDATGKTVTRTALTTDAAGEFEVPAPPNSSECGT